MQFGQGKATSRGRLSLAELADGTGNSFNADGNAGADASGADGNAGAGSTGGGANSSGADGNAGANSSGNSADGSSSDGLGGLSGKNPEDMTAQELALLRVQESVSENEIRNVLTPDTSISGEIQFTFAGDVLFDRNYSIYATYLQREADLERCIAPEVLEIMRCSDVMVLNNEFPYSDRGQPTPNKIFTFRAEPESVQVLSDMGVDLVSLANNHASDYGRISLEDSLDILRDAGIPYVGAGRTLDEAKAPMYYVVDGYVIALISATQIERSDYPSTPGATEDTPGVFRCFHSELLLEQIRGAKEIADFVILYVHWGTESTDVLDWRQKELARECEEAGVDLIIGGHPHVLQEIGYVGEVPVVYSLGNFWFNSKTLDSCLVRVTIREGELKSLQFIPCQQTGCGVRLLEGAEKQRVLNYMRQISGTAKIDDDGYITRP